MSKPFQVIPPKEKADDAHPFRDATGRHPTDATLRSHGFRIHSRPKSGEAVWERRGAFYGQRSAVELIDAIFAGAES